MKRFTMINREEKWNDGILEPNDELCTMAVCLEVFSGKMMVYYKPLLTKEGLGEVALLKPATYPSSVLEEYSFIS